MSPIRPENRHRYGDDWSEFSDTIRFGRAGGRCECEGECGRPPEHLGQDEGEYMSGARCVNRHGKPAYGTGSKVVLTVAHLCHTPECRDHIKAMCQAATCTTTATITHGHAPPHTAPRWKPRGNNCSNCSP